MAEMRVDHLAELTTGPFRIDQALPSEPAVRA
jgi:hypothetical protein